MFESGSYATVVRMDYQAAADCGNHPVLRFKLAEIHLIDFCIMKEKKFAFLDLTWLDFIVFTATTHIQNNYYN